MVRVLHNRFHHMLNPENRNRPFSMDLPDQVRHFDDFMGIEPCHNFVEKKQVRFHRKGSRQFETPSLMEGEVFGQLISFFKETRRLQEIERLHFLLVSTDLKVLQHRHVYEWARDLEGPANPSPRDLIRA